MPKYKSIVVLTGAGLSAESGLSTFRDSNGIWSRYDWRDVATPQGFEKNPTLVHDFYNMRRRAHADVKPNAAHLALGKLSRKHPGTTIVTQNVDCLHEAAGTERLIHMHGEAMKSLCAHCEDRQPWTGDMSVETLCAACGQSGGMRPDVVWFGEMPYHMEKIGRLLLACDLFISIGTSGNVYPAAGFVAAAREAGAHTVELNLEPSQGASLFAEAIYGPATQVVPAFVARLLATNT
ncbi:MAG: NAD-dependent deacylase [Hyphomicrobium sp.]